MSFLWRIFSCAVSLFLADKLLDGVAIKVIPGKSVYFGFHLTEYWQILFLISAALAFLSSVSKFLLKTVGLPLKILTLGLISIFVNIFLIWVLDVLFLEFQVTNLSSLILTGIIFSFVDLLLK